MANSKPYLKDINLMKNELSKVHWHLGSTDSRNTKNLISTNKMDYRNLTLDAGQNSKILIEGLREKVGASHLQIKTFNESPIDQKMRY